MALSHQMWEVLVEAVGQGPYLVIKNCKGLALSLHPDVAGDSCISGTRSLPGYYEPHMTGTQSPEVVGNRWRSGTRSLLGYYELHMTGTQLLEVVDNS